MPESDFDREWRFVRETLARGMNLKADDLSVIADPRGHDWWLIFSTVPMLKFSVQVPNLPIGIFRSIAAVPYYKKAALPRNSVELVYRDDEGIVRHEFTWPDPSP